MSLGTIGVSQPEPYDLDEDEIQLMDMDEANLQLEEQTINPNVVNKEEKKDDENIEEEEEEEEEKEKVPSLLVIEVCFIIKDRNK